MYATRIGHGRTHCILIGFFVLGLLYRYITMLNQLLVLFFLVNALFWGLATHHTHCDFAAKFGVKKCPPHWVHVWVMGLGSFVAALYFKQGLAI